MAFPFEAPRQRLSTTQGNHRVGLLPPGASDGGSGGWERVQNTGLSPRLVWLSRTRKDPLRLPGRSSSSSAFCRLTPSYSHLHGHGAGTASAARAGTPSAPARPALAGRGDSSGCSSAREHILGHPGRPGCLPSPSAAPWTKMGQHLPVWWPGFGLGVGQAAVGPCPLRPTLRWTLPSIYLCLTLATQLLGMWHSLPDTSDATSHQSPSLREGG